MSKSIYEEAIKVVTYLQEQDLHLKDTTGTIYISTENITTLENLLIHSHKQEKLLELYRKFYRILTKDSLTVVDMKKAMQLEQQINELENNEN